MVAAPSSRSLAGGGPASGLPRRDTAAPQYAMPHEGSAWAAASNPAIAWLNQNEWSRATARVNSFCAAWLQDVGKFTAPSFSGTCCAPADAAKRNVMEMAMARDRIVVLLFSTQIERPRSWQRTCQQRR